MSARRSFIALSLPLVAFLASLASAAPNAANLVYPLQSQRPPVARVNQTWSWTLLPGTFNASSGSTITLSSRSLPSWASFDAGSETFTGLPGTADVGSSIVTVQANVSGVAVGTLSTFTLLVVDAPVAYVFKTIASQLPSASSVGGGVLTADGALEIPPNWSFSLGFQQYTFQDASYSTIYYTAYLAGTTELPSWITFDNRTVTFDGVTPATLGEYTITVFGSDHFGYGDVEQTFKISVGFHSLELLGTLPAINSTPSGLVSYVVPLTQLVLDNSTVTSANVSVAVALSSFPYLTYNSANRTISGTLPSTLSPANISLPITFTDQYNDTVSTVVSMNVQTALFDATSLPALLVHPGKAFSEDLTRFTSSRTASYAAVISPVAAQSWLHFDATTLIVSGTAPSSTPSYGNASLALTATDPVTGASSRSSLGVDVSTTTSSSTSSSATPSSGAVLPLTNATGLSHAAKLAIGLTLGIIFGLLLLFALWWFCFRGGERRIRREGSTLIFDQATIAAAQRMVVQPSTGKSMVNTPASMEKPRKSITGDESAQRDAAAAVVAANAGAEASWPKRIGLMGLFKGSTPKKETATTRNISLPLQSQNSLYGLGIDDGPRRHHIVVVTEGGTTYAADAEEGARGDELERDVTGISGVTRSSSWESGGSSSLFYSDGSDTGEGGVPRPRQGRGGPPSAPRQRRDFLPLPLPIRQSSPSPSPRSPASAQTGIRMVGTPSPGRDASDGSGSDRSDHQYNNSSSYPNLPGSTDSITSIPGPRLIPFTTERVASDSTRNNDRRQSHHARPAINHRNSAMMDADEETEARWRDSGLYAPGDGGSPTTSAVFFTTPREDPPSSPVSQYDAVRLVGSRAPSMATASMYSHNRSPSFRNAEPTRMVVEVGRAFRFTPQMNPPPFVSITSSPGRGGPPRATHLAFVDDPTDPAANGRALPSWLHFDQSSLQVWGKPREEDVGELSFYIVERKAMPTPGSPTRRGGAEVAAPVAEPLEQIVGRYVLDIAWSQDERGVLQLQQVHPNRRSRDPCRPQGGGAPEGRQAQHRHPQVAGVEGWQGWTPDLGRCPRRRRSLKDRTPKKGEDRGGKDRRLPEEEVRGRKERGGGAEELGQSNPVADAKCCPRETSGLSRRERAPNNENDPPTTRLGKTPLRGPSRPSIFQSLDTLLDPSPAVHFPRRRFVSLLAPKQQLPPTRRPSPPPPPHREQQPDPVYHDKRGRQPSESSPRTSHSGSETRRDVWEELRREGKQRLAASKGAPLPSASPFKRFQWSRPTSQSPPVRPAPRVPRPPVVVAPVPTERPRISTAGLAPIRHRLRSSGTIEILPELDRQLVLDVRDRSGVVLVISGDGQSISVFENSAGIRDGLVLLNASSVFERDELPPYYEKLYTLAFKFVEGVRGTIPQVVFYTRSPDLPAKHTIFSDSPPSYDITFLLETLLSVRIDHRRGLVQISRPLPRSDGVPAPSISTGPAARRKSVKFPLDEAHWPVLSDEDETFLRIALSRAGVMDQMAGSCSECLAASPFPPPPPPSPPPPSPPPKFPHNSPSPLRQTLSVISAATSSPNSAPTPSRPPPAASPPPPLVVQPDRLCLPGAGWVLRESETTFRVLFCDGEELVVDAVLQRVFSRGKWYAIDEKAPTRVKMRLVLAGEMMELF